MSTSTKPASQAGSSESAPLEFKVVSHTGLLYWWPVWLVGFVLSGLTYLEGSRMAIVPKGTALRVVEPKVYELTVPNRPGESLAQASEAAAKGENPFHIRASGNRNYGMVYIVVLLLVIAGSNTPLRGRMSLVGLLALLVLTIGLAYFNIWDSIMEYFGALHIEISLAGYLVPSVVLLALWLVTVFGLDRMRYVVFSPGQFTVRKEIGDGCEVYNLTRVTLRKRRTGLFRDWILGLGTGELIVAVPNQGPEIALPNVLFVDRRIQQIADLMNVRPVAAD